MSEPTIVGICWSCRRGLTLADYGRETSCVGCGKDTRACRNCRFFAPGRPNDCIEPMAEPVKDKQRANFCEYFEPAAEPLAGPDRQADASLREAAEALFRK